MFLKLFFAFLTFAVAMPTYAQIFDIEVIDYGGLDAIPTIKTTIDTELQNAEDKVNKDFPSGTPDRMMEGMANSSVMAGKGIGTDYASNMSVFIIGAGVGVAADLEKPKDSDSDLSGVGVAPGVMVGFNLGFLDAERILGMHTDRLNLYFNFMSYKHKQILSDKADEESDITLDTLAFGTHVRYDWITGAGNKALGWGGVKLNFGFEYNKSTFDFKTKISEDVNETVSGTGEVISGKIEGTPVASILASTMSIPLALSTDVQILYFFTLYGGLGADYNMGEAKGKGNLNGKDSTLTCTGGAACGTPAQVVVRPTANLDTSAKVDPFTFRGFAGFQFNLPWTRIFVQVDKSLSNDLVGATAGLRFAF
jgi:hypothetical protein